MTDRKLVYRVEINSSQAKTEAKAFAAQIKAEFANLKINALDGKIFTSAEAKIDKLHTKLQALAAVQPPKVAVDTTGLQQASQQADNLEKQLKEVETQAKRTSAAVKVTSAPARTPATGGGVGGGLNLGNLATGALGVAGISLTVAGIVNLSQEIATLRKESLLATTAFNTLSGGAGQASARLTAMKNAAGGTLTTMEALRSANQITALGMASTAEGFGRITQAARGVTFVSPVISDIGSAITELSLASANLSFRRLDQLGLSVTEVKDKMAELQSANSGLNDNQAFLEASVSRLIEKYGGLTESVAAQAQGVDQLRTAWEEFKKTLADGTVGQIINDAQSDVAGFIDSVSVRLGNKQADTLTSALKHKLENASSSFGLENFLGFGDLSSTNLEGLQKAIDLTEQAKEALAGGAPGAQAFFNSVTELASGLSTQLTPISKEQIAVMAALEEKWTSGRFSAQNYAEAIASSAEAQRQANEAAAAAQAEALVEIQQSLTQAATQNAAKAAGTVGQKGASEFLKEELARVDRIITDFETKGLKGAELVIAVKLATEGLDRDLEDLLAGQAAKMEEIFSSQISASLGQGIRALNTEAVDASPALSAIREELIQLESQYLLTGVATEEMVARHRELTAVADAVASSTGVYAALQNEAGQALLTSDSYAASLASNIAQLDAAQVAGKISAGDYASQMYALVSALIAAAEQAGITGAALASLIAIRDGIDTSAPGFNRAPGDALVALEKAKEDARQREENRKAAERAAREQEQSAKRAARELEQGAKRAARELESALSNVPGLFSTSKVTQKDLDFAAGGGQVNFADNFVRRFRDFVDNGKMWDDATPEKVRAALQNVGIDPAGDLKTLLGQLEEAWNNSSLFASKDNLALFDEAAVQQSLDLQEKMKQGRANIMEYFGVAIDDATGAITGVAADTAGADELKTAVSSGEKKIIDHLTGATNTAVNAATAAPVGTAATGGSVQITSVTIAPSALAGLFSGITPPAIVITDVTAGAGLAENIATAIDGQVAAKAAVFQATGNSIGDAVSDGFALFWTSALSGSGFSESIRVVIGAQIQVGRDKYTGQGGVIAGMVGDGFVDAWIAKAQEGALVGEILNTISAQRATRTEDFKSEGITIANTIKNGLTGRWTELQQETGLAGGLRTAFGIQFQAMRTVFVNQGDLAAGAIEQGFADHWTLAATGEGQSSLAGPLLGQLTNQFTLPATTQQLEGMGGGMGNYIMLGLTGFDFGSAAGGMIGQIEAGIASDTNYQRLFSVGGMAADALFNGYNGALAGKDWIGAIVAVVIAQLNAGVQANG